jgi:ABC-2 type transport system ATP-binding protein
MSSHLVSDLERICDYLIVIVASRVQVAGQVSELLARHRAPDRAAPSLEDVVLTYMRPTATSDRDVAR